MRQAVLDGGKLRIIRPERLHIPLEYCIEHIAGESISFLAFNPDDGTVSNLRIEEASTVEAADSFINHLSESLLAFDPDEAAAQIDMRIATLRELIPG